MVCAEGSETYYMSTDFSSIPSFLVDKNDSKSNAGVLKDETSNGLDILSECNSIFPSRDDKCFYPMGDLRNERDGWITNNNKTPYECVKQPGADEKSDCVDGISKENNQSYKMLADWTKCGNWESGGKNVLLSWLECNYDSLHFRKVRQSVPIKDNYSKRHGATTVTKEAQRMYNSSKEFLKYVEKGNENLIALFGIKYFGYWPHKEFVDRKEIGNSINASITNLNINSLEQNAFILELMGTEVSSILENRIIEEKKNLY